MGAIGEFSGEVLIRHDDADLVSKDNFNESPCVKGIFVNKEDDRVRIAIPTREFTTVLEIMVE